MTKDIDRLVKMKTEVLKFSSDFFVSRGFKWLLPRLLSPVTDPLWPDPAGSGIKPAEIEAYGQKLKLVHSLILHKQIAIGMGIDKLFYISPNVRFEREDDGWHAFEFHQLDFEVSGAKKYDVTSLIADYFMGLTKHLDKTGLIEKHEKPFRYLKERKIDSFMLSELEDEFGSVDVAVKELERPFFVFSIPREFYDFEDPETGIWHNYDLYVPPYGEVVSGAEREWEYEKIVEKIKRDGLRPENFGAYLRFAKEGKLRPSAGAGIGLDRVITLFLRAGHIEEAQLFPRIPGRSVLV